jgi:CheY-like chemotaxis protein
MRNSKRPILLVEDDQIDAMTVKRALKDLNVSNELVHKVNGREAIEYLKEAAGRKPCVILLDLNMPKMNGVEFLRAIKPDEKLKRIPVVVLTTSNQEQDVANSFDSGVAGYIVKPTDYKKFVDAMKAVDLYWTLCELPEN